MATQSIFSQQVTHITHHILADNQLAVGHWL